MENKKNSLSHTKNRYKIIECEDGKYSVVNPKGVEWTNRYWSKETAMTAINSMIDSPRGRSGLNKMFKEKQALQIIGDRED